MTRAMEMGAILPKEGTVEILCLLHFFKSLCFSDVV